MKVAVGFNLLAFLITFLVVLPEDNFDAREKLWFLIGEVIFVFLLTIACVLIASGE